MDQATGSPKPNRTEQQIECYLLGLTMGTYESDLQCPLRSRSLQHTCIDLIPKRKSNQSKWSFFLFQAGTDMGNPALRGSREDGEQPSSCAEESQLSRGGLGTIKSRQAEKKCPGSWWFLGVVGGEPPWLGSWHRG